MATVLSPLVVEAEHDALIGAEIDGRYEVTAKLGEGGMGAVYRAHQPSVGRDVAIKVLATAVTKDPKVVQRFQNEARAIAQLRHPNTLKVLDTGTIADGRMYIATELVEGEALVALLRAGRMSPDRVARLGRQLCDALGEAHARGIVHRDLKPGNLMVEPVGDVEVLKLLDFGIAKLTHQPKMTTTGMIFGTPAYMSPEQARGEAVDHRSDIYSVGLILYECVSGEQPFECEVPAALLLKHAYDPATPLSDLADPPHIPPELEDLIMQMLEKDPAARPQSMAEVRAVLEGVLGVSSASNESRALCEIVPDTHVPRARARVPAAPQTIPPTAPSIEAPGRRRLLLVAGALGLAAAVAWALAASTPTTSVQALHRPVEVQAGAAGEPAANDESPASVEAGARADPVPAEIEAPAKEEGGAAVERAAAGDPPTKVAAPATTARRPATARPVELDRASRAAPPTRRKPKRATPRRLAPAPKAAPPEGFEDPDYDEL